MTFLSWGYVVGVICVTLVALTSAPGRFAWSASADCAFACWVGTEPCHGLGRFCSWRRASTVPRMTEPKAPLSAKTPDPRDDPSTDDAVRIAEQTACGYDKAAAHAFGIPARISSIRIMVRSRIVSEVRPRRSRVFSVTHLSSDRCRRWTQRCSAMARAPAPTHRTHRGAMAHCRARWRGRADAAVCGDGNSTRSNNGGHAPDFTRGWTLPQCSWYRFLIGASVRRTFADKGPRTRTGAQGKPPRRRTRKTLRHPAVCPTRRQALELWSSITLRG